MINARELLLAHAVLLTYTVSMSSPGTVLDGQLEVVECRHCHNRWSYISDPLGNHTVNRESHRPNCPVSIAQAVLVLSEENR